MRWFKDPAAAQTNAIAWKLALAFLLVGATWVISTDLLVYRLVDDRVVIARLETAKGWIFVGLATATVYFAASLAVRRVARSSATLRAIFTSISDGVVLVDRNRTVLVVNPAGARMLGVEHPEDLSGVDGRELASRFHVSLPDGRLLDPDRYATQRALDGETPAPYKAVLHPPGQPDLTAIVTAAPVRFVPDGPVNFAVSVIHDVTAISNLQKMRDEFIASAAHTLRTPIAIISAQTHLLAGGLSRSVRASSEAIERQCRRLTRITENLFVLARLRSDSLHLEPDHIDLADVVADAVDVMQQATADHVLALRIDARPTVFADRDRFALVVRDMIELAIRRSPPHAKLEIVVGEREQAGRVSITYEPIEDVDVNEAMTGFEGLGLEQHVIAALVEAATGKLGSKTNGRRVDWVELPEARDA